MNGDKTIREQLGSMQVSFDKEAAWGRLHGRLEAKSTGKKFYRLGWAAAVLILAATVWQLLPLEEQPAVTEVRPKLTTPKGNENITIATTPVANTGNEKTLNIPVAEKQEQYRASQLIADQPAIQEQQALVVEVIHEPAIQKKEEPAVAVKPKMKVMHINEVMEEERVERRVLNSRYADNKYYDRPYHRSSEDNPYELRNPFKIYISTQN